MGDVSKVNLTQKRLQALREIAAINDRGRSAHVDSVSGNRGTMYALEKAGLIISKGPFQSAYHSMVVTDAGRAELRPLTKDEPTE